MSLVNKIITEIHKKTKKIKYNHYRRFIELYSADFSSIDKLTSYYSVGVCVGFYNDQRIIKKYKFGKSKYKLEIFLQDDLAICIDDIKVQIYNATGAFNKATPIYNAYTIDNDSYFNLSLLFNNILNADEIELIRKVLRRKAINKKICVYGSTFILAGLLPSRW